ncbi:MAG: toxin TcdB middle/N-terminal domain-containing protein [Candidatus Peregrinibacteria bacterium]
MKAAKRFLVFLLLPVLFFTNVARAEELYAPDNHNKPDPLASSKQLQGNFRVGEFTGAAIYDYPLALPPGRNGLTPSLSLTYNSQADNKTENIVGYHWDITQFSIKRLNKHGVDKLYQETFFVAETPAGSGELVPMNLSGEQQGEYGLKTEGSFSRYEFLSDVSWRVTDKQGTRYTFGATEESRQFDPTDPSRVYAWMPSEIRDTNDNFIRYTYSKHENQIYPKTIVYTGHGSEDGIFEVRFLPFAEESNFGGQPDRSSADYSRGFPVQTLHSISGVRVYAQGILRRQYDFEYRDVSSIGWLTLSSITETGFTPDGTATALPPATFDYTESRVGWDESSDYLPEWNIEECQRPGYGGCNHGQNVFLWDMTGDGLEDFEYVGLLGSDPYQDSIRAVNNGQGGWTKVPGQFTDANVGSKYTLPNSHQKVMDWNGDARADLVGSSEHYYGSTYSQESDAWLSTGEELRNIIPLYMVILMGADQELDKGVVIGDLNGDGLPDMIQNVYQHEEVFPNPWKGQLLDQACLNQGGQSCQLTDLWHSPMGIVRYSNRNHPGIRQMIAQDCNLDGLTDLQFTGSGATTWINDGKGGWIENGACPFGSGTETHTKRQADFNGDGLMDWAEGSFTFHTSGHRMETRNVQISIVNDGIDFPNIFPVVFGQGGNYNELPHGFGVRIVDLNGDLLPDVIQGFREFNNATYQYDTTKRVWLNNGERPYFLKTIHTSEGAQMDLEYKTSAQAKKADGSQANPNLPIVVTTVSKVTTNDGLGNVSRLDYAYEDGFYHFNSSDERGLAGFRILSKTDSLGFTSKTYFHQSQNSVADAAHGEFEDHFSKSGMPYREEMYDQTGQLVQVTTNRWESTDLGNGRFFPLLAQTVSRLITPETSVVKATAQTFEYDAYGNQTRVVDYGEVSASDDAGEFADVGADLLETRQTFTQNTTGYLVGLPAEGQMFDQTGALLSHERHYYDSLGLGEVSAGNETRAESWLDTSNTFLGTERTYDEYGLPLAEHNPRGYETTFSYDDTHLSPIQTTNAKGHVTSGTYDWATGQPLTVTDPNGTQTVNFYDGLGRILEVKKTNPADPGALVTVKTAEYDDTSMPRSAHEIAEAGNGITVEAISYLDGLGRTVEQKSEGTGEQWVTAGTLFDERGNVKKSLQPYFSSSSAFEPPDLNGLGTEFAYDTLNRVTTAINPLGTTTTSYFGWSQAVTDPNGNSKDYEQNSRGNLLIATEHNGAEIYLTHYTYDPAGRLISFADSMGNIREFTYDSLGRRLTQTAPHLPTGQAGSSTQSPSRWSYEYDENGNVVARVDAKNQTIQYAYDELDRLVTEDFLGTPEADYQFAYDQNAYGLGRLSQANSSDYLRNLTYDPWGRVVGETKTIRDHAFPMAWSYDLLNSVTDMQYPDGSALEQQYNEVHQLSSVAVNEQIFASNFSYSPLGQITQMQMGDGTVVASTYDPNQLYRLTRKQAALTDQKLQDLSYVYDPMGNVLSLQDAAPGITAKNVAYAYDPLYRLTQAIFTNTANQQDRTDTFAYNSIGNILNKSDVGDYVYDSPHPHAVTAAGSAHLFTYDTNGNLTGRDGEIFVYDHRDRLTQSGSATGYLYDESDQRIAKINLETGGIKYYPSEFYEIDDEKEVKYVTVGDQKIGKIEVELTTPNDDDGGGDGDGDGDTGDDDGGDTGDGSGDDTGNSDDGNSGNDDGVGNMENPTVTTTPNSTAIRTSGGGNYRGSLPFYLVEKFMGPWINQSEELISTPKKLRPKIPPKTDLTFHNLQIEYNPEGTELSWNPMPKDVVAFQVYRSKRPYDQPGYPSQLITTIKPKPGARLIRYTDEWAKNKFYSYRVTAVNEHEDILTTSIELAPEQVYLTANEPTTVDFTQTSHAPFNKVFLVPNDQLIFTANKTTPQTSIAPKSGFTDRTKLTVRYLNCRPKTNGKESCIETDEKALDVFVIRKPTQKQISFK